MREPMPDPIGQHLGRVTRSPRPIVPLPALGHDDLRGRRVVVGLPGLGWRHDLRADEKVVQGSRTYVPIMPEHEWYRAELEQIEVFAPLVPADRVWVERLATEVDDSADFQQGANQASVVATLDAPPRRVPVPVVKSLRATGSRLIQLVDGVERRDLRALTEHYTSTEGDTRIRVTTELEWYRWTWTGQPPKTIEVPVRILWLE
ncbi:hypothetical protein [Phytohabitans kaempferiae]|uniref:Uncharacterized protein n=1 Tax=Phytohabitans kaempferiae TaxID=1620943 RepID=A0ABV6MFF6_9ACTN